MFYTTACNKLLIIVLYYIWIIYYLLYMILIWYLSFILYSCYRVYQGELHVKRVKIEIGVATKFYGN